MINGQIAQISTVTFTFVSTTSSTKTMKHWGQLILEAYDWQNIGNLVLALRNVSNATFEIQNAKLYVGGVQQINVTACSSTLAPSTYCKATIAINGLTVIPGVAYQIAIVPPSPEQGQGFTYSAVAGHLDWIRVELPRQSAIGYR